MANIYIFADLLVFTSGQGDKTTSPSFAICYVVIETSSTSLDALIATLLPTGGATKHTIFQWHSSS